MTATNGRHFSRGVWIVAAVVAFAFALGWLERGGAIGRRRAPAGDGQWIWLPGDWRQPTPTAFLAAADFELERRPASASLVIAGDEEYVAWLNGWPVGSGRYHQGAAGGRHALGDLLRLGGNRLVVESRSLHGGGGLLAWIEADGARLAPTGPDWSLFRSYDVGVVEGWRGLPSGERPKVWGAPPMGRWREMTFPATATAPLAIPGSTRPASAARGRSLAPLTDWRDDWADRAFSPALWSATLLEWDEEVEGYLELRFLDRDSGEGMLFFASGDGVPAPALAADVLLARLAGQDAWRDALARRFRRVLVAVKGRPIAAVVWPGTVLPAADQTGPRGGVLGVVPPPLRSPVEDKLRREFEGFADLAGG